MTSYKVIDLPKTGGSVFSIDERIALIKAVCVTGVPAKKAVEEAYKKIGRDVPKAPPAEIVRRWIKSVQRKVSKGDERAIELGVKAGVVTDGASKVSSAGKK